MNIITITIIKNPTIAPPNNAATNHRSPQKSSIHAGNGMIEDLFGVLSSGVFGVGFCEFLVLFSEVSSSEVSGDSGMDGLNGREWSEILGGRRENIVFFLKKLWFCKIGGFEKLVVLKYWWF